MRLTPETSFEDVAFEMAVRIAPSMRNALEVLAPMLDDLDDLDAMTAVLSTYAVAVTAVVFEAARERRTL